MRAFRVVNTLDEVDRVLSGIDEGLMYAPRDPSEVNTNKSEQLEAMLVAKKSVVSRRRVLGVTAYDCYDSAVFAAEGKSG